MTTAMTTTTKGEEFKATLARVIQRLPGNGGYKDRMQRAFSAQALKMPDIINCTPASIMSAAVQAQEAGIVPDGISGYLIPYKTNLQFIPSYKGLIELALGTGKVASIRAKVVRSRDRFEWSEGLEPNVIHRPALEDHPDDDVRCVYAIAKLKDPQADPLIEVMTKQEIDRIRTRSKAANRGPWVTDYSEMARKTVVRRLCKYLPRTQELNRALEAQEHAEIGIPYEIVNAETPTSTDKLRGALAGAVDDALPDWMEGSNGEREPGEEG